MEASTSLQRNVDLFKNYLQNIWRDEKPLCKLFSTEKNNYLYDTGTNKIVKCENPEFELLNDLMIMDINDAVDKFSSNHSDPISIKTFSSLEQAIKTGNILKLTKIEGFKIIDHIDSVIDKVNNYLSMIQLELTENCNLRCGYCIYNDFYKEKRNYANVDMTEETAKKAIDYLKNHSKKKDRVGISFYGGEPLLKYGLMKKIVDYAKEQINKEVSFSVTTNGTLIDDKIATFLSSENFSILVSLDGPEDIHDAWRKDIKKRGSFQRTLRGLCKLHKSFENKLQKLGLSMVYAPPFGKEKVERIANFIISNDCIPDGIMINITYPSIGTIPADYNPDNSLYDNSLIEWIREEYSKNYIDNKKLNPIAKVIEKSLAILLQRPVFDIPMKKIPLNGCCTPGVRKLYINARGEIELCERVNKAPKLGNIYDGLNFDVIRKVYLHDYAEKSIKDCSKCWSARLCNLCYQHTFTNEEINIEKKRKYCNSLKQSKLEELKFYCSLLEGGKASLNYLYEMELS